MVKFKELVGKAKKLPGKGVMYAARGMDYVATKAGYMSKGYGTAEKTYTGTNPIKRQKTMAAQPGKYNKFEEFVDKNGEKILIGEAAITGAFAAPLVVDYLSSEPSPTVTPGPIGPANNTTVNDTPPIATPTVYNVSASNVTLPNLYINEFAKEGEDSMFIASGDNLAPHNVNLTQDLWSVIYSKLDNTTKETVPENIIEDDEFSFDLVEGKKGKIHYTNGDAKLDIYFSAIDAGDVLKQSLFDTFEEPAVERAVKTGNYSGSQLVDDGKVVPTSVLELNQIAAGFRDKDNEFVYHSSDESLLEDVVKILEKSKSDRLAEAQEYDSLIDEVNQRKADGSYVSFITQTGVKNGNIITMGALKYNFDDSGTMRTAKTAPVLINTTATHDILADHELGDNDAKPDIEYWSSAKLIQHDDIWTSQFFSGIGDIDELEEKVKKFSQTGEDKVITYTNMEKLYDVADHLDEQGLDSMWLRTALNDSYLNVSKVQFLDVEDTEDTGYHVLFWSKDGSKDYWPERDHGLSVEIANAIAAERNKDKDRLF